MPSHGPPTSGTIFIALCPPGEIINNSLDHLDHWVSANRNHRQTVLSMAALNVGTESRMTVCYIDTSIIYMYSKHDICHQNVTPRSRNCTEDVRFKIFFMSVLGHSFKYPRSI